MPSLHDGLCDALKGIAMQRGGGGGVEARIAIFTSPDPLFGT